MPANNTIIGTESPPQNHVIVVFCFNSATNQCPLALAWIGLTTKASHCARQYVAQSNLTRKVFSDIDSSS